MAGQRSKRRGFTLVELVVVVLIVGILAAVAAPKMFDTATDARDSAARQSLTVVRDAIELYKARNGSYPGTDETTFKTALQAYLRGQFPSCPVGANKNANVGVQTTGTALSAGGTTGWKYDNQTGEFIINDAAYSAL